MSLPYPTKVVLPFDIATAQDMNERHANDVALASGSGLDNDAVTADKIDFSTFASNTNWDTGWVDITSYNSSYNSSSSVQVRRVGSVVKFRGAMIRNTGNVTNGDSFFTIVGVPLPTLQNQAFLGAGTGGTTVKFNINNSNGALTCLGVNGTTTYGRVDNISYFIG